MPIGVEGGCRHGNPTIGSRSPPGSFAIPGRIPTANGQLCCHIGARPSDREPRPSCAGRVAFRGRSQSSSFGKGSRLGNRNRRGNGVGPVCHLVCVASSAVSHAGIPGEEAGLHICRNLDAARKQVPLRISCPPAFSLRITRYTFCGIWSRQTAIPSTNLR
jgi:hypothetical protein